MRFHSQHLDFSLISNADFDDLYKTMNDRQTCEIISFLHWPLTKEQVQNWIDKSETAQKQNNGYFFIARNNDNKPAGCISLHLEQKNSVAEIGYWVAPDFQGQGIATEMLATIIEFGFKTLALEELFATTAHGNAASENVLRKNGFIESGAKDVPLPDGTLRPSKLFVKKRTS
ncbi:MAG: GNAT family N-acetyltransferase [Rhodospirillales bacterium]|nr:GNAT family N-acetyltransferase [Alphaproteobacteria bacterium]MCB9981409.1 GNAT family N-acetyltransferase [Rhodospirillales bacterium]